MPWIERIVRTDHVGTIEKRNKIVNEVGDFEECKVGVDVFHEGGGMGEFARKCVSLNCWASARRVAARFISAREDAADFIPVEDGAAEPTRSWER